MGDSPGCGCSTDIQAYRWIDAGGSVTFDWPGTYFADATLTEQCAGSAGFTGSCAVEQPVLAGELTITLHLLTDTNVSTNPGCGEELCTTGSHSLGGQEETVTASIDFAADGAQALTVTVD